MCCLMAVDFSFISFFKELNQYSDSLRAGLSVGPITVVWGGGEIFSTRTQQTCCSPSILHNGYRVIPGEKAAGA